MVLEIRGGWTQNLAQVWAGSAVSKIELTWVEDLTSLICLLSDSDLPGISRGFRKSPWDATIPIYNPGMPSASLEQIVKLGVISGVGSNIS